MLARSALITRWNSNQVPWIHRGNSNQVPWDPWLCILPAHGSMVVHRVPARRLPTFNQCLPTSAYVQPLFADVCILPARSALITRWNSNQVPWDPSRELHRVPSRGIDRGNCIESRPMDPWLCIMLAHGSMVVHHAGPWIHGCASSPGPAFSDVQPARFADVCIRSTNVCRRLHTSGLGIHGCASCWPMDPRLCIMLAHGSKVVHHAGPHGIHRGNCIESPPVGSIEGTASSPLPWGLHHAGPVGVDHSMELQPGPLDPSRELQPGPLGSMVVHTSGPGIQGCASCWPMDPWLCILPAIESRVVHRVPSRGDRSCWPGRR